MDSLVLVEDFFSPQQQPHREYSSTRFRTTVRHRELIERVRECPSSWAQEALLACLEHLLDSRVTEAWRIGIIDAYVEDDETFSVVYRTGIYRRTTRNRELTATT